MAQSVKMENTSWCRGPNQARAEDSSRREELLNSRVAWRRGGSAPGRFIMNLAPISATLTTSAPLLLRSFSWLIMAGGEVVVSAISFLLLQHDLCSCCIPDRSISALVTRRSGSLRLSIVFPLQPGHNAVSGDRRNAEVVNGRHTDR